MLCKQNGGTSRDAKVFFVDLRLQRDSLRLPPLASLQKVRSTDHTPDTPSLPLPPPPSNSQRKMLRSASSSLRQLPLSSRSLLRAASIQPLAAAPTFSAPTRRLAFTSQRAFSVSSLRRDEEGVSEKPAPVEPLPAKFELKDTDLTRLARMRNVGISAHIDSGPFPSLFPRHETEHR